MDNQVDTGQQGTSNPQDSEPASSPHPYAQVEPTYEGRSPHQIEFTITNDGELVEAGYGFGV